ncbi:MAG: hypothetical protein WD278_08145, partial [Pirellulales bacterium]
MSRVLRVFVVAAGVIVAGARATLAAETRPLDAAIETDRENVQGLTWFSDYGAALEATKAARKPLLVVLDDPSDRRLRVEQVSRRDEQGADDLLAKYTLCHVDVSTAYGREVARRFRAREFPSTAIIDREGRTVIFSKAGHFSDESWRATLSSYRDGRWATAALQRLPLRLVAS